MTLAALCTLSTYLLTSAGIKFWGLRVYCSLESDITLHHDTSYHSNLDSIDKLGPLAKIVSLQQVQSLEDIDYHQPLHEHLGFVS